MTIDSVSCFKTQNSINSANGSVSITNVTGGVPGYSYYWTTVPNGAFLSSNPTISSLEAGNYACLITDTNGCQVTVDAQVHQPDQLFYTTTRVIGSTCDGACNGQIHVNITGGLPPYYFDVDEVGSFPFVNTQKLVNDSIITDLCHGAHDVYISDKNGCVGYLML